MGDLLQEAMRDSGLDFGTDTTTSSESSGELQMPPQLQKMPVSARASTSVSFEFLL